MATDKTRFDDWLKENLWRDLAFRSIVWISLSGASAYFALTTDAQTVAEYLTRQLTPLRRLINIVGTSSIFLGLIALMFKDMEQLSPDIWGQKTKLGLTGGGFRRLAGDATLWTVGAFVAILFTIALVGLRTTGSLLEWALFVFLYLILGVMAFVIAFLSVLVRRASPFLAAFSTRPALVLSTYIAIIVGLPIYLYISTPSSG